jgi:hypothetical protein
MEESQPTRDDVIAYARLNGRVCPLPWQWNQLYELLPSRQRVGNGWEPAPPLILAAWHHATGLMKILRLQEHIDWADKHGALPAVAKLLYSLPEDQWHHLGE